MNRVFFFDIDGTLTNRDEREFSHLGLVKQLSQLISQEKVFIITGRSPSWVIDKVISKLPIMSRGFRLTIYCEYGGVCLKVRAGKVSKTISINGLDKLLSKKFKELVHEKYSKEMFIDETKEAILTAEMIQGVSYKKYLKSQSLLVEEINKIISIYGISDYKVLVSQIAVDVVNFRLNKASCTAKCLKEIKKSLRSDYQYFVFGDSLTDVSIAGKLFTLGLKPILIFVGEEQRLIKETIPYKVVYPIRRYNLGVYSYLKKLVS